MAKKHKQHQKRAKRAHRTPSERPVPKAAATPATDPTPVAPSTPAEPPKPTGVQVTFRGNQPHRDPAGVSAEVARTEYPSVRRDLRKLGLTIVFFTAVLVGLSIVNERTTAIADLGTWLFTWWR